MDGKEGSEGQSHKQEEREAGSGTEDGAPSLARASCTAEAPSSYLRHRWWGRGRPT